MRQGLLAPAAPAFNSPGALLTQDTRVRPAPGPMSEEDLSTALSADLEDAATYADTELGPLRAAAIHYYHARKFGDEEDGRSQVVMPIVRDTIRATLPSLMRQFFGSNRVVDLQSGSVNGGDFAEDAAAVVEYVFTVQNPGYKIAWDVFKDALRCKTGWVKWFWDKQVEVTATEYSGCTPQQVQMMNALLEPGEELRVVSKTIAGYQQPPQQPGGPPQMAPTQSANMGPGQVSPDATTRSPVRETGEGLQIPGPAASSYDADGTFQPQRGDLESPQDVAAAMGQQLDDGETGPRGDGDGSREFALSPQPGQTQARGIPVYTYTIEIVKKTPRNRVRVMAVPPDEIIFPHDAWDIDNCRLLAHRTRPTRGELVAMGVDPDDLESIPSDDVDQLTNIEFLARQTIPSAVMTQAQSATWDQVRVPFYECYYRIDADGDGISELRKIQRIGKNGKIVSNQIWDEVPLALLCPDPEPHVIVGLSQADHIMDLQNVQSHVWRDLLDSLKQSIFPRVGVVEGQANIDDALNTEIGAIVRMRAPGMVQPFNIPFTGKEAFPLLQELDQVREQRTGIGQAAMALDGKALQSTTPVAAQATVTASQAQVEMTARMFADGFARMFRGILRLLVRHQDAEMQFALNGRAFNINPKTWNPDIQAVVDTGLGVGTNVAQQLEALDGVAKAQLQLIGQLGPNNPLCGLDTYYNVVSKMMRLAGFRDTHRYWLDPTNQQMQQGRQIKQPPPMPEQIKAQADTQNEQTRAGVKRLQLILDDERDRAKTVVDAHLKVLDINAKYGTHFDGKLIDAQMQRESHAADANLSQMEHEQALEQQAAAPQPQGQS